jgi:shikimate dehydrogenase
MKRYALLGRKLGHSFSRAWFSSLFERLGLNDHEYINIETEELVALRRQVNEEGLSGFNVTIPYKSEIIPLLDDIDPAAEKIGAVNTVAVLSGGRWKGYNTDAPAFRETLTPRLKPWHTAALVLGSGGASKAVTYVLNELGLEYRIVSRQPAKAEVLSYAQLTMLDVRNAGVIINASPVGTFPHVDEQPDIPYEGVDKYHLLYDLVYNPPVTRFMKSGMLYGADVMNGYAMLVRQAELAWTIWNTEG